VCHCGEQKSRTFSPRWTKVDKFLIPRCNCNSVGSKMHKDGILTFRARNPRFLVPLFGQKTGFRARMNEIKSGIPCSAYVCLVSTCAFWTQQSCICILALSTFQGDMQLKRAIATIAQHATKTLEKGNNISFEPKWIWKVPTYSVCMNQSDYSNMGVWLRIHLNRFWNMCCLQMI
jgi:hypothetical protein